MRRKRRMGKEKRTKETNAELWNSPRIVRILCNESLTIYRE